MLSIFGKSRAAKEKEKERRRKEREENQRITVVRQLRDQIADAVRVIQLLLAEDVPPDDAFQQQRELFKQAMTSLETDGMGKAFDDEEKETLKRLEQHEIAAETDAERYAVTFTEEKKDELRLMRMRREVRGEIDSARRIVYRAEKQFVLKSKGDALFAKSVKAIDAKKFYQGRVFFDEAMKCFTDSGFEAYKKSKMAFTSRISTESAVSISRVWFGHVGRVEFRKTKWKNELWRIEAESLFNAIDTSGDGIISREELHDGLTKAGFSTSEIDKMTKEMDEDESGTIERSEFMSAMKNASLQISGQKDINEGLWGIGRAQQDWMY
ncbi:hypothetical protein GUITHDRAFT_103507 [Guillardia theta CCMP2712]|uniref:EF-hand domain-containing protein n=1 Tax=Guillardia theta (strain CCMP2712) TaxID=905079 RepID=L1JQT8_GUITC|nr:hypothetical protein GUITHDRAFT_103507 [Guillardia theta CCMP2712]EKX50926.1 hypothetical protein GUITHDRAFT_103507 [Guillardia theta CCMP2712]|eukprot:XP_005837906.1 hypothetical protein GUITHDRAFT_103507 [Guillardia theta CCMP2712]